MKFLFEQKPSYLIFWVAQGCNFTCDHCFNYLENKEKKVELIRVKEIFSLTGYVRGGCSPIGMKKKYPTYIDETCTLFEGIYVSAGVRGLQLYIAPELLIDVVHAQIADLV